MLPGDANLFEEQNIRFRYLYYLLESGRSYSEATVVLYYPNTTTNPIPKGAFTLTRVPVTSYSYQ